jgi:hypothetical protein
VHKTWPYLDKIVAMILTNTTGCVVLVGDESCQLLEQNWEAESRVVRRSGVWSIRQTLAFIDQADLLVGPETGVMNAAGLHPVPEDRNALAFIAREPDEALEELHLARSRKYALLALPSAPLRVRALQAR